MSTNHLSKEFEIRLKDFFINVIDPKEIAKMTRQVNYALSLCVMRGCEMVESEVKILKGWILIHSTHLK